MDFRLDEAQERFHDTAREFLETHQNYLYECKREAKPPLDIYEEGAEYGFPGVFIPKEYGGEGRGAIEYGLISESISFYQPTYQLVKAITSVGTDEQKGTYLPEIAAGKIIGSDDISEPDAGSSFKDIETFAAREGNSFVINGHKSHVNFGGDADVHQLYAQTEEGLTAFLVEADNPGLIPGEKERPIGSREMPLRDVIYDECMVHEDQILGELGGGYRTFFKTFNFSRIGNASKAIGIGERALDRAIAWSSKREVGDKGVVTDFQGNRWDIAELKSRITAAKHMRNEAAWLIDNGENAIKESSMAKLLCCDISLKAVEKAMQLTGAHGLYEEQHFGQDWADAKVVDVAGGSREIMRNVIADEILD